MTDRLPEGHDLLDALAALAAVAGSLAALGDGLVVVLAGRIAFDRFNIGLIDGPRYRFRDAYVFGHNVPGRASGHERTLDGTVVEAAIRAREVFSFGAADPARWLERFPRFGPVLDSGIRSMLAVPLEDGGELAAALVFASRDPAAYGAHDRALAAAVGRVVVGRIAALGSEV